MVLPEGFKLLELGAESRWAVEQGLGGVLPGGAGICSMEQVSALFEPGWRAEQGWGLPACLRGLGLVPEVGEEKD